MTEETAEVIEQTETVERDFEAEASRQGWSPDKEGLPDPTKWVDAKTFVERADNWQSNLKKQVEHLKLQVKKLTKMEQRAYDNALKDLKAKQAEAVEFGDVKAFKAIDKQIDDLREDIKAEAVDPNTAFVEFREANEWYDLGGLPGASDAERRARALADRIADKLAAQGVQNDMSPPEFFARVADEVRAQMPTLDSKPARLKPASDVAGVTRPVGVRSKTGANLPPEAKAQAKRFFDKGIIKGKDLNEAYEKFAKDFAWEQ